MDDELLPQHGGYRNLKSFQIAQLVYDLTFRFCNKYINIRSRTHDQMVQAARSGVQNIAEGSLVSGTSKKMEMKLTNVARASLEELKLDYENFLRHRGLQLWDRNDARRQNLIDSKPQSLNDIIRWTREVHKSGLSSESTVSTYPEITANAAHSLIAVATALLNRQIKAQGKAFEREGGFTERLYRRRKTFRKRP